MTDRLDATVAHLNRLVGFPTISADSNLDLIDYIETALAAEGIKARRIADSSGHKASLLATIGPAGRPGVVLSAHTDVVPAGEANWSSPPFTASLRERRVYGRDAEHRQPGGAMIFGFSQHSLLRAAYKGRVRAKHAGPKFLFYERRQRIRRARHPTKADLPRAGYPRVGMNGHLHRTGSRKALQGILKGIGGRLTTADGDFDLSDSHRGHAFRSLNSHLTASCGCDTDPADRSLIVTLSCSCCRSVSPAAYRFAGRVLKSL